MVIEPIAYQRPAPVSQHADPARMYARSPGGSLVASPNLHTAAYPPVLAPAATQLVPRQPAPMSTTTAFRNVTVVGGAERHHAAPSAMPTVAVSPALPSAIVERDRVGDAGAAAAWKELGGMAADLQRRIAEFDEHQSSVRNAPAAVYAEPTPAVDSLYYPTVDAAAEEGGELTPIQLAPDLSQDVAELHKQLQTANEALSASEERNALLNQLLQSAKTSIESLGVEADKECYGLTCELETVKAELHEALKAQREAECSPINRGLAAAMSSLGPEGVQASDVDRIVATAAGARELLHAEVSTLQSELGEFRAGEVSNWARQQQMQKQIVEDLSFLQEAAMQGKARQEALVQSEAEVKVAAAARAVALEGRCEALEASVENHKAEIEDWKRQLETQEHAHRQVAESHQSAEAGRSQAEGVAARHFEEGQQLAAQLRETQSLLADLRRQTVDKDRAAELDLQLASERHLRTEAAHEELLEMRAAEFDDVRRQDQEEFEKKAKEVFAAVTAHRWAKFALVLQCEEFLRRQRLCRASWTLGTRELKSKSGELAEQLRGVTISAQAAADLERISDQGMRRVSGLEQMYASHVDRVTARSKAASSAFRSAQAAFQSQLRDMATELQAERQYRKRFEEEAANAQAQAQQEAAAAAAAAAGDRASSSRPGAASKAGAGKAKPKAKPNPELEAKFQAECLQVTRMREELASAEEAIGMLMVGQDVEAT
eukprot:TRINITY_DN41760_c0_g1_i3.p1 TRINITY_DN41760_c0_g1~~TRINITY_DN41760_c0_g1_i3.p1  ORF type:complete len:719 (+),score=208.59 TRINITY_DN41760_c0_g1_i3:101-2257(+)